MTKHSDSHRQATLLFVAVLGYVIVTGCLMQFLVLPHVLPGLHAGEGLLRGLDTVGFHHDAVALMQRIQENGWSAWSFRPDGLNTPPGIIAVVYYFTTPHPYILLPFNGILWGLTALMWLYSLRRLFPGIKAWTALGALVIVIFPSAFTWTTQFHKDIFTIPGCSLVFYALIRGATSAKDQERVTRSILIISGLLAAGLFLIWLGRPYLLQLVLAGHLAALSLAAVAMLARRILFRSFGLITYVAMFTLLASLMGNHWAGNQGAHLNLVRNITTDSTPVQEAKPKVGVFYTLDQKVYQIGRIRLGYCSGYATMGSAIDCGQPMNTVSDALSYLPRALQIALFSPFPETWVKPGKTPGGTQMRMIAGLETTLAYIIFFAAFVLIASRRVRLGLPVLMAATFLLIPALIQTYANPNVGTLYRMRYGFWTGLIAISLCLIISYWLERRNAPGRP